jgi:hypothetical protein
MKRVIDAVKNESAMNRDATAIIIAAMICVTIMGVVEDGVIITAVAGLITSIGGILVYKFTRKKGG